VDVRVGGAHLLDGKVFGRREVKYSVKFDPKCLDTEFLAEHQVRILASKIMEPRFVTRESRQAPEMRIDSAIAA